MHSHSHFRSLPSSKFPHAAVRNASLPSSPARRVASPGAVCRREANNINQVIPGYKRHRAPALPISVTPLRPLRPPRLKPRTSGTIRAIRAIRGPAIQPTKHKSRYSNLFSESGMPTSPVWRSANPPKPARHQPKSRYSKLFDSPPAGHPPLTSASARTATYAPPDRFRSSHRSRVPRRKIPCNLRAL